MQEPSRVGIAFVTALILHGSVLAALAFWSSKKPETPPGEQEITIDFAPAMQEAISVAPAESSAVEVPPTEVEAPPLEITEAEELLPEEVIEEQPQEVAELSEPEQITEALPVDAPPLDETTHPPEDVITVPPPETVTAQVLEEKPAPKPVKPPPPKPERKPRPVKRREVAEQRPPAQARQGQASGSRENMGGAAASADPNVLNRYKASLVSALRRRLRYPPSVSSRNISGTAVVRFTMDRSGRVISASMVRSSGNSLLDQAALAAARPGSALPTPPESVSDLNYTVPLSFTLRR